MLTSLTGALLPLALLGGGGGAVNDGPVAAAVKHAANWLTANPVEKGR